MPTVIKVENLSKKYIITHQRRERYVALRDVIANNLKRLGKRLLSPFTGSVVPPNPHFEELWALKDINLQVDQGKRIGIIGRNGAGKTTLLKVLSRITEPTQGRIWLRGRVASLLEVGTGFHPELTGRENIYLNGAILGMSKTEIKKKFDQIVDFAEVEKFLDTPVKRYSSGMYVRLAFAIAAHLEPEILLIDEVLAVGDASFQKKCLGKMEKVSREEGRTVLFVSHNMMAIRNLCSEAIWLDAGKIMGRGSVDTVTERYLQDMATKSAQVDILSLIRRLPADPAFRLHSIALRQDGLVVGEDIVNDKSLEIQVEYEVMQKASGLRLYVDLCDEYDDILMRSFHDEYADERSVVAPGRYLATAIIPENFLAGRQYKLIFRATIHNVRSCTPGGVPIPLKVVNTSRINRAYLDEPGIAKLTSIFKWHTVSA